MNRRFYLVATAVIAICWHVPATTAWSFATEEIGNAPQSELNYTIWKGIMPLVNDQARVYATWANGNERLYYRGTTKELNAALARFAMMEVEHHVVVLRPGPAMARSFKGTEIPYNWELQVIGGLARLHVNSNKDDLDWQQDPVLTICIAGDIDLAKLDIPREVTLAMRDADKEREGAKQIEEFIKARKKEAQK